MISFLDHDFSELNQFLQKKFYSKLFILVDENTHQYCLPTFLGNLETDLPYEIIEIEAGEEMKTIETASQLWEILTEMQADRQSLLINLGGGVITDLGGFIASTYKRGIPFIHVPTTLLGLCDASLGGKTGVDIGFYKNMVGTFAESEAIFCNPDFLKTLPFSELRSGFAEMLKHGLIADESHWNDLINIKEITPESVKPFIEKSMMIKQNIVEQDFKEKNIRKTLNFGHTIGHSIESLFLASGNPIAHGEAVVLGMIMESYISFSEKLIDEATFKLIVENLRRFYPYISIDSFNSEQIFALMLNDKKNIQNQINFSLISAIGNCNYDVKGSENVIKNAIQFYKSLEN